MQVDDLVYHKSTERSARSIGLQFARSGSGSDEIVITGGIVP
jgi:hypothetical protein